MKLKIAYILSIITILFFYSSEISFMPNYKNRPDKWHLIYPMFSFSFILFSLFIWGVVNMIKKKKIHWDILLIACSSTYMFLLLNNPKDNAQEYGYIGLIIISTVAFTLFIKDKYIIS